jgi:hypothetical protein
MAKSKGQTTQWPKVKDRLVLSVLYFWSLCCLSFTFGHCVVCPLLLAIVLSVLYFWPLCCLFFTFGHCVVCPLLLAIVLSILPRCTRSYCLFGIFKLLTKYWKHLKDFPSHISNVFITYHTSLPLWNRPFNFVKVWTYCFFIYKFWFFCPFVKISICVTIYNIFFSRNNISVKQKIRCQPTSVVISNRVDVWRNNEYGQKKRTENTMTKSKEQTTQWPKVKNRQHNDQK